MVKERFQLWPQNLAVLTVPVPFENRLFHANERQTNGKQTAKERPTNGKGMANEQPTKSKGAVHKRLHNRSFTVPCRSLPFLAGNDRLKPFFLHERLATEETERLKERFRSPLLGTEWLRLEKKPVQCCYGQSPLACWNGGHNWLLMEPRNMLLLSGNIWAYPA